MCFVAVKTRTSLVYIMLISMVLYSEGKLNLTDSFTDAHILLNIRNVLPGQAIIFKQGGA